MLKREYRVTQQLSLAKVFRKWSEYSVGDILIGKVVGEHKDGYDKINMVVKVEECHFKKDAAKYEGKNLVLNSCGSLDYQIKQACGKDEVAIKDLIGQLVQIEYQGLSTIEKGKYKGKEVHNVSMGLVEVYGGLEEKAEDYL